MTLGFGLHQEIAQRPHLECTICKHSINGHHPDCPQGRLKALALLRTQMLLKCPKCRDWALLPNHDDYLECVKCKSLFSRGYVAKGYNPDTLEKTYIMTDSEAIPVLVIPEKGAGDIQIEKQIAELLKIYEKAKADAKNLRDYYNEQKS